MTRRWKIALALAVVGLAAFLVWAFRTPVTPPLTIRFYGYVTNDATHHIIKFRPPDGLVYACFAVTNHSSRSMEVRLDGTGLLQVGWLEPTNSSPGIISSFRHFKPGEGMLAGTIALPTNELIQAFVQGWLIGRTNSTWASLSDLVSLPRHGFAVSATNELR